MNYKPYAGWWFYGGTTPTQIANSFSSWGLTVSMTVGEIAIRRKGHPPWWLWKTIMEQREKWLKKVH